MKIKIMDKPFATRITTFIFTSLIFFSLFSAPAFAAQPRFDAIYLFQDEEELVAKKVDFKDMARYTRDFQNQIGKILKPFKMQANKGWLIFAIRSDGEQAIWFDMEQPLDAYFEYQINDAIQKIEAFGVDKGMVVFAIKMSIDTPQFTQKAIPEPNQWAEQVKAKGRGKSIEHFVFSMWPVKE